MKRIILLLAIFFAAAGVSDAQVSKWNTTDLAIRYVDEDTGRWTDWSDWEECHILVVINLDKEVVSIYSAEPQEYDIYDVGDTVSDELGGESLTLNCVDAEGIRCEMRLRVQDDGQAQLYVDYADISWVYNIEPK